MPLCSVRLSRHLVATIHRWNIHASCKAQKWFHFHINVSFRSYGVIQSFRSLLIISFRYLVMWKAWPPNKFHQHIYFANKWVASYATEVLFKAHELCRICDFAVIFPFLIIILCYMVEFGETSESTIRTFWLCALRIMCI